MRGRRSSVRELRASSSLFVNRHSQIDTREPQIPFAVESSSSRMLSHLSQFTLNILLTSAILLFHAVGAYVLIGLIGGRVRMTTRVMWKWAAVGILILNLPIIYLQLIYKSHHPLIVDQILYLVWIPWGLLLLNFSILCAVVLVYRLGIYPFRKRRRKEPSTNPSPVKSVMAPIDPIHAVDENDYSAMKQQRVGMTNAVLDNADDAPLFQRRRFIRRSAFALGGLLLNGSVLAAANSKEDSRIERVTVRIPNLPEGLKGTTIAMISDIHSSLFMTRENMEYYANILKSLKADMIVLPGDFVNSKVREVYPFAEAFSGLSAPLGVYGVTGNHDYYTREIDVVAKEVEQAGIRMLRNENLRIEKNGVGFRILGIDDDAIYDVREYRRKGKTEKGRIENLLKGIREDEPTIFLCHKPYPFEDYAQLGIDLTLSGHTHGGQIVLGKLDKLNVSVASLASTYIAGLYKARSNPASQMYVSRGIGAVGVPVRINCPPEVTHITLV